MSWKRLPLSDADWINLVVRHIGSTLEAKQCHFPITAIDDDSIVSFLIAAIPFMFKQYTFSNEFSWNKHNSSGTGKLSSFSDKFVNFTRGLQMEPLAKWHSFNLSHDCEWMPFWCTEVYGIKAWRHKMSRDRNGVPPLILGSSHFYSRMSPNLPQYCQ